MSYRVDISVNSSFVVKYDKAWTISRVYEFLAWRYCITARRFEGTQCDDETTDFMVLHHSFCANVALSTWSFISGTKKNLLKKLIEYLNRLPLASSGFFFLFNLVAFITPPSVFWVCIWFHDCIIDFFAEHTAFCRIRDIWVLCQRHCHLLTL